MIFNYISTNYSWSRFQISNFLDIFKILSLIYILPIVVQFETLKYYISNIQDLSSKFKLSKFKLTAALIHRILYIYISIYHDLFEKSIIFCCCYYCRCLQISNRQKTYTHLPRITKKTTRQDEINL